MTPMTPMPYGVSRLDERAAQPMKQSRAMSLVESITNVVVGFVLALVTQMVVFPMFGLSVSLEQNVVISSIFTVVSIARSFVLRRVFEAIRTL